MIMDYIIDIQYLDLQGFLRKEKWVF